MMRNLRIYWASAILLFGSVFLSGCVLTVGEGGFKRPDERSGTFVCLFCIIMTVMIIKGNNVLDKMRQLQKNNDRRGVDQQTVDSQMLTQT